MTFMLLIHKPVTNSVILLFAPQQSTGGAVRCLVPQRTPRQTGSGLFESECEEAKRILTPCLQRSCRVSVLLAVTVNEV